MPTLQTFQPAPSRLLGAHLTEQGVHFGLYSRHATAVELVLFDSETARNPAGTVPLEPGRRHVWSTHVPGLRAGQLYAYRVSGPWEPAHGHRFDHTRLLLDPYARALTGSCGLHALRLSLPTAQKRPSYPTLPRCVVVDNRFDWGDDQPPRIPWPDTVIYETHVKGLTAHPSSRVRHPGTYLGLVEAIPYLKDLGITAVELLPVHHCQSEVSVLARSLTNYWGYMTLGYFAPDRRFAAGQTPDAPVWEFKTMVRALHQAGLEVILDVVYNHTAEGTLDGPTLCWRGIDNRSYYATTGDPRRYRDTTGCGNSLDCGEPVVVQMVMDSLRYWVEVMHVDGFRFDLATTLGRETPHFSPRSALLSAMLQDPVLSQVKLIAEPWDVGPDSYQLGRFPDGFAEWNGRYRDTVRQFIKGDFHTTREFVLRQSGSPDIFPGRPLTDSINFVCSHDGFPLRDLVTWFRKHNEANGERNRDGDNNNHSWNWGVEGETNDLAIQVVRRRLVRNYQVALLTAWGVPMLLGGDEFFRTQGGNNNAYAQDNEVSWYDWDWQPHQRTLHEFVRRLLELRRRYPQLRPSSFDRRSEVDWLDGHGKLLKDAEPRTIMQRLHGARGSSDPAGRADLLIVYHLDWRAGEVVLPSGAWLRLVDTSQPEGREGDPQTVVGRYVVMDRSVVIFAGMFTSDGL